MKKHILIGLASAAAAGAPLFAASEWNAPTPPAAPTRVTPRLNVEIGKETEEVTFVNTNNDPFVFTRVYKLQHADPYELRPYVMAAIRSRRIDTNNTTVEAVKYADGTGMLIVSAEEYRFGDVPNGMSIGDIIRELDKPKLASEAGRKFFLYYPQYFDATTLAGIIRRVGLVRAGDNSELQGGIDAVRADTGLNALFFHTTPTSAKTVRKMLAEYDAPTTEALVRYTIYELNSENDGNLGIDFQAWKNGPGMDLFATGARFSHGWDFVNNNVASNLVKSSHTSFINFNPKWNSKYLDFLVANSKARVVTTGSVNIMNRVTATVAAVTRMPVIGAGAPPAENAATIGEVMTVPWDNAYALSAIDQDKGLAIALPANYTGTLTVTRTTVGKRVYYNLATDGTAVFTRADGKILGDRAKAYDVVVSYTDNSVTPPVVTEVNDYSTDTAYAVQRDATRKTALAEFGFQLAMTPEVFNKSSIVRVSMSNTNLIGFKSNGEPRTSRSELDTKLQLDHEGGTFYIGGLDKKQLVRSVNKVPFLGDIPVLGWLFSAESEVVKNTRLVAVLEIAPTAPATPLSPELRKEAETVTAKVADPGVHNYGFDQYVLDPEK